jgi:fucose 4-O-acetylase-like acetyltransferase
MQAHQNAPVFDAASRYGRVTYFDVAKGISIVLVVFFHTTTGFVSANIIANSPILDFLDTMAYAFHVHLFFAISGYFAVRSLDRAGSFRTRMLSLYYPYLVWSVISLLASIAADNTTNNHYSWQILLTIPVHPILHYWFLLSLMIASGLLYLFRSQTALVLSATISLVMSMMLSGWMHDTAYFYPCTVIGALCAIRGTLPIPRTSAAVLCFFILISGTYLADVAGMSGPEIRSAPFIPVSLAGCYGLLWISSAVAERRAGRVLGLLGKDSLVVYLMHVLIAASLRILLYNADPALNGFVGVAICFAASLALPIMAKDMTDRLELSKLAGFEPLLTSRKADFKATLAPTATP